MKKIVIIEAKSRLEVMKRPKNGHKTVAVYSTVDRNSPHVKFADEAVWIGESPSNQSICWATKLLKCKSLNVDAIHRLRILK
jgi:propionyl-CoA carboxylase alpha chain